MKTALKKKWVQKLKSRKIKQADGYLHKGDGSMCCLGVLCMVAGVKKVKSLGIEYYEYDKHYSYLTPRLLEKVGISVDEQTLLAKVNDNGASFIDIANWIDENL